MLIDWEGRVLSPEEILRMAETEDGKKKLKEYIKAGRTAFTTQEVLSFLQNELKVFSRSLTAEEQQDVCNVIWHCFFTIDQSVIMEYIREVAAHLNNIQYSQGKVGNA